MFWIVQENTYNERGYDEFLNNLQRLDVEHTIVKIVPFIRKIFPTSIRFGNKPVDEVEEINLPEGKKVIFGSISLTKIAKERGWTPGAYTNENFDYSVWSTKYPEHYLLNPNAIVDRVCNLVNVKVPDWVFVRPAADDKAFTGIVMSKHDLHDFILQYIDVEEAPVTPLHGNTIICISPFVQIYAEYRCFIVNNTVVASSMYKRGGRIYSDSNVDRRITLFATPDAMPDMWQPADAYVLDIADTPDGLKIIEINCINNAGFYACDTQKIITAIRDLEQNT